jgi:hypothetical protein
MRIQLDITLLRLSRYLLERFSKPLLVLRIMLQRPLVVRNTLARLHSPTHLA